MRLVVLAAVFVGTLWGATNPCLFPDENPIREEFEGILTKIVQVPYKQEYGPAFPVDRLTFNLSLSLGKKEKRAIFYAYVGSNPFHVEQRYLVSAQRMTRDRTGWGHFYKGLPKVYWVPDPCKEDSIRLIGKK